MYKAVILPLANQDIKEAVEWYNAKQKRLGKRFIIHIRQKVQILKWEPYSSAIRYDETRTAVLDIFPFMIHYNIDESNQLITISAILHTSRNPDIWKSDT